MKDFASRQIEFTVIKVNNEIELMIKVMKENYDGAGRALTVSDISKAVSTKSFEEVTKTLLLMQVLSLVAQSKKILEELPPVFLHRSQILSGTHLNSLSANTCHKMPITQLLQSKETQFQSKIHLETKCKYRKTSSRRWTAQVISKRKFLLQ
jgi:hypothetical protein